MRLRLYLAFATVFLVSPAARADTVLDFNIAGVSDYFGFGSQNVVNGMVSINTTTGLVVDFLANAGPDIFSGLQSQFGDILFPEGDGGTFFFNTGISSLVGYTGSTFNLFVSDDTYSGDVTLASTSADTPEPSSFLLLTTGLLGLAGVSRRRFSQPSHVNLAPSEHLQTSVPQRYLGRAKSYKSGLAGV